MKSVAIFLFLFLPAYFIFLSITMSISYGIFLNFGYNSAFIGNLISFWLAVSISHVGGLYITTRNFPLSISGSVILKKKAKIWMSICAAIAAIIVDFAIYTVFSKFLAGEIQTLPPVRYVILAIVYGFMCYFMLGFPITLGIRREARDDDFGPDLVRTYKQLSNADKSALVHGLDRPELVLLTSKGSPNDLFWRKLSQVRWMEQTDLPELEDGPEVPIELSAWKITKLGLISIPSLIRRAHSESRDQETA